MNPNENNTDEQHNVLNEKLFSSHKMGIITIVLIFGIFGIWSVFAKISTTITAQGKVVAQSYNKTVMHPNGGMVKSILVKEGDSVKKEQPLIELDSTKEELEKDSNVLQYDNNLFSICRLTAQAHTQKNLDCTHLKEKMIRKEQYEFLNTNAQETFRSNVKVLEGKIDYLLKNNETLEVQNTGLTNQITTSEALLKSYKNELAKWKKLLKADAVDEMKAIDTERRIMQASLEIESLKSKINENLTTIKSNQSQIFLEKATFENTAMQEANDLKQKNELIYNDIQSLQHMIKDAVIRSPSEGQVTDLKIYASGEVVSPQRPIMSIVPNNQNLMIEAFVLPMDIERVYTGQEVEISFPAFVSPSALPMKGKITYVSADAITPENEKESFYTILIQITPEGLDAINKNGFTIVPGMPSTAFVKTGKQTFMAYLMNPFIQIFKGIYNAN